MHAETKKLKQRWRSGIHRVAVRNVPADAEPKDRRRLLAEAREAERARLGGLKAWAASVYAHGAARWRARKGGKG